MMDCSVVIPVYRGEATLEILVDGLAKVLPQAAEQFEVVLVNDDSPDDSWTVIRRICERYPWVRGIRLSRNFGQENATLCGILESRYAVIATMDDDLQHRPQDIPLLLSKMGEGFDVVYGVPRIRRQAWWKRWLSGLVKRLIAFSVGAPVMRGMSAFKAFRGDLRETYAGFTGPDVSLDVLLSWKYSRFGAAEVEEAPRAHGRSNYGIAQLVRIALKIITNYTTIPLRLASIMGFVFTIVGFLVFVYVLIVYFSVGSIPGFPFLASLITVFSGVQLFALGIIGEYLARIFERSSGRPRFAVREYAGTDT
jgi:glycosyltransferase involved in cell wall biosynthesis